jgi:hypothetical protein
VYTGEQEESNNKVVHEHRGVAETFFRLFEEYPQSRAFFGHLVNKKMFMHIRFFFIFGTKNVVFCCLGRNNKLSQKQTNYPSQRRFYVPQVSINCLACPKGIKYKQISNKQAGA